MGKYPAEQLLLYDSTCPHGTDTNNWGLHQDATRHNEGYNASCLDGHAKFQKLP